MSKTLLYLQPAAILKLPQYEVSILDLTHNPHYAIIRFRYSESKFLSIIDDPFFLIIAEGVIHEKHK